MEPEADLFAWQPGDPPRPMTIVEPKRGGRECRFGMPAGAAKGYAELPGTGPDGEFCKTCGNTRQVPISGGRHLYKCQLRESDWTKGRATDILLKSPACKRWIARETTDD